MWMVTSHAQESVGSERKEAYRRQMMYAAKRNTRPEPQGLNKIDQPWEAVIVHGVAAVLDHPQACSLESGSAPRPSCKSKASKNAARERNAAHFAALEAVRLLARRPMPAPEAPAGPALCDASCCPRPCALLWLLTAEAAAPWKTVERDRSINHFLVYRLLCSWY